MKNLSVVYKVTVFVVRGLTPFGAVSGGLPCLSQSAITSTDCIQFQSNGVLLPAETVMITEKL